MTDPTPTPTPAPSRHYGPPMAETPSATACRVAQAVGGLTGASLLAWILAAGLAEWLAWAW